MENNDQKLSPQFIPPVPSPKKWYQLKGLIALVILAILTAVAVWIYFAKQPAPDVGSIVAHHTYKQGKATSNQGGFQLWDDGSAYVKGVVIGNVSGCEVDGICSLIVQANDQEVSLVYAAGERQCPNTQAASWVQWGKNVKQGTTVQAYGIAGMVAGSGGQYAPTYQLTFCDSQDYFILGANDPIPSIVAKKIQRLSNSSLITGDYCSMANGCPSDKCRTVSNCGGGGDGNGCTQGSTTCEYKDSNLKDNYTEVSAVQANQCVQNFIAKNLPVYPTLKYFQIDASNSEQESTGCQVIENNAGYNQKDTYCWFVALKSTVQGLPFTPDTYVGAQTCSVYWDLPDTFKVDLTTLTSVNYSPDQAIACAENYIAANNTKYLEYKNFVPGSLSVPNKTPSPAADVTNSTKDVATYTVIGNSSPQSIYLAVGAHSCTVYGVNEKYYTKINP